MSWFKRDDFEVRKLREEVRELQGELMKLRESTAMYETLNPLEMLGTRSFGFYFQDKSVPISAVVYGIVKHLGLDIRREPEKPSTVLLVKPEQDGQAARP